MIIVALVLLAAVILEFWSFSRAPFGYQDDRGFHLGIERGRNRQAHRD